MKIRLLGTGNPVPTLLRASSSYLLRIGEHAILFDHGPGAYWRMMQAGVRAVDITHVIFTHLHYDHCIDFIRLYLNRWDQGAGRVAPLQVYGPRGTRHFVDRLFGGDGAFKCDLDARTTHPESVEVYRARGGSGARNRPQAEVTELEDGDGIDGGEWQVIVRTVPHAQPFLSCHGVRLTAGNRVVAYSSDITPPHKLGDDGLPIYGPRDDPRTDTYFKSLAYLINGADLLLQYFHLPNAGTLVGKPPALAHRPTGNIADSMHLVIADLAQKAGVKRLVLTHFAPNLESGELREVLAAQMRGIYRGELIWGEDLQEFELQ